MTIPEEIAELEKQLQSTTDLKEQAEVILLILEKYASINSLDISPNIERLLVLAEELNSREYKAWVDRKSVV